MKRIAIIGSEGMLGSDLVHYLRPNFEISRIHKRNYKNYIGHTFDILINANGNSKRFWAQTHPLEDFEASTVSVYRSLLDFTYKIYVYISSNDVYENHSSPIYTSEDVQINVHKLSPYGFHKYLSELLVRKYCTHYLILRSSMILGRNLKKGPFYDILHKSPLYITKHSSLQLITTNEIANIIHFLLHKNITNEIFNVGGRGAFLFNHVQSYFDEIVSFSPKAQKQVYESNIEKLTRLYALKNSVEYLQYFIDTHK